jgi:hypothetical protein
MYILPVFVFEEHSMLAEIAYALQCIGSGGAV